MFPKVQRAALDGASRPSGRAQLFEKHWSKWSLAEGDSNHWPQDQFARILPLSYPDN